MTAKRTLIIDDEADNASIGYSKKAGLIEARTIATQVSELRSAIQLSSFLQVTATPYSLYLQPTEIEVANVLTFKPTRPAFTKLVPVPAEYVGGETYFGESARSETDTLESLIHHTVDHREFDRLKKPDGRSFKLEEVLTAPENRGIPHCYCEFRCRWMYPADQRNESWRQAEEAQVFLLAPLGGRQRGPRMAKDAY